MSSRYGVGLVRLGHQLLGLAGVELRRVVQEQVLHDAGEVLPVAAVGRGTNSLDDALVLGGGDGEVAEPLPDPVLDLAGGAALRVAQAEEDRAVLHHLAAVHHHAAAQAGARRAGGVGGVGQGVRRVDQDRALALGEDVDRADGVFRVGAVDLQVGLEQHAVGQAAGGVAGPGR